MSSKTDWIDELENEEDALTFFQQLNKAIYSSRHDIYYWYPRIIAMIEDDERTEGETKNPASFSVGEANKMTKKRIEREP